MVEIKNGSWVGIRLVEPIITAGDKFKPITIPLAKAERIPEIISKAFPVTAEELRQVAQELLAKAALIPPAPLAAPVPPGDAIMEEEAAAPPAAPGEEQAPPPETPEEEPAPPTEDPAPVPSLFKYPPIDNTQTHPGVFDTSIDKRARVETLRYTRGSGVLNQIFQVRDNWSFHLCTCSLSVRPNDGDTANISIMDENWLTKMVIIELFPSLGNGQQAGLSFFPPITIHEKMRIVIKGTTRAAHGFIHGWEERRK